VLKLAEGYRGDLSALRGRFILGNFVRREDVYTYPAAPIRAYESGAPGTLEVCGR
jgi:hypothetical protein